MAEEIIAPGTYLSEVDKSFTQSAPVVISGAFIGPTLKGEAFIPTQVTTNSEFIQKFGSATGESYIPYAVEHYLKFGGTALVTRVLGTEGYKHTAVGTLIMSSSLGEKVVGVIHHTSASFSGSFDSSKFDGGTTYVSASAFGVVLSGSLILADTFSASMDSVASNYIGKIIGKTPKTTNSGYFYTLFENYIADAMTADPITAAIKIDSTYDVDFNGIEYAAAETPWVVSQLLNASAVNLFKFKQFSHGEYTNSDLKIGITNIKRSSEVAGSDYGTFTVVVRSSGDKDKNPVVYETFQDMNLDPTSTNYISRVIGDKYKYYDVASGRILINGNYDNQSAYITVEVSSNVSTKSMSAELVPYGFAAVVQPVDIDTDTMPSASFVTTQEYNSIYNEKVYYGFDYDFTINDNANYLMPIPATAEAGDNVMFNLDNYFVHADAPSGAGLSLSSSLAPIANRKFIVPFQGGFSGMNPATPKCMGDAITATNTMGYNLTNGVAGNTAYTRCINILSNKLKYNFHLLFTPGVINSLHSSIVSKAIDMVETRANTLYIFDSVALSIKAPATVVTNVETADSSYSATYWPWVKIFDSTNNTYLWVPASTVMASVMSYNDKVGYEWYAPAGYNRASLDMVVDANVELDQSDIATLYGGRVNPIGTFANDVVVWGQKTLQAKTSALDRVNVRRLLINLKYFTNSVTKYLNFEQHTEKLRAQFVNKMNPYMTSVQQRSGLYAFKVIMDETINTGDVIDRNQLRGKVKIQPTKTAEFILIDFEVYPTGADFSA